MAAPQTLAQDTAPTVCHSLIHLEIRNWKRIEPKDISFYVSIWQEFFFLCSPEAAAGQSILAAPLPPPSLQLHILYKS